MRVLTLWQPWASLVALGIKTVETRPKPAPRALIGERIAIHAAARRPDEDNIGDYMIRTLGSVGMYGPAPQRTWVPLPLGAIVCTAVLADSVPILGRWAYLLTDVEPLTVPVPFRGGQGWSKSWEPS